MSTYKDNASRSTAAATMTGKVSRTKITTSKLENGLKDENMDENIELETFIQYLGQIKNELVDFYINEARSLLSKLMPKFKGTKEYFLLWVRFLNIAYVHKKNKDSEEEEEAFKTGIEEILTEFLLKDPNSKSIDWRIARKILSLKGHFTLLDIDLQQVQEGMLKAFKSEIDAALDHLVWLKESLFVDSSKTTLISLRQYFESPEDQEQQYLLEAVLCGRFDKEKFSLKNSLVLGEDGGLYVLLNRMNQQQQDSLVAEQIVTRDYLKDKIKANDKAKGDKIVVGTGESDTVRFALSLFKSRSLPGEILYIKKTKSFQDLSDTFFPSPLEQVTELTLEGYFTHDTAPFILDMSLVTSKNVVKDDMKDHRKGYLMIEIIPQNTATRIFAEERYQRWEYQQPYLLDVLESTQRLLESDIAMTDLKPDNTLYDTDTRKATIIDLGGSVKVASKEELSKFEMAKYSFQSTKEFQAPELSASQGVVNMHKSLAYTCGKVIDAVTRKSDCNQQKISQLIKKLTVYEPEARMSLPDAINELKRMGDDSFNNNVLFCHYISQVKDRLQSKKSAIGINEDIDKTRELFFTLNVTSLDPLIYKNLQTEDLFEKIDNFFTSQNPKQVMAIFGAAGSGKSSALQLKFIQAVHDWKPGQPLPIYFNLANGLELDHIVRTLNTELGTNLSLKDLNGQHLYIDSFDEGLGIEDKRETLVKEYFRQLGSPKILITCRSDYLHDDLYDRFSPEFKELEVCYVAPINYNGHESLPNMVEKYVSYFKRHNSIQHTAQDYLKRLNELQLTDLINTGFMFFLIMEVLFQLQDKTEKKFNKIDIYTKYINHYQNTQIDKLTQDQNKKLAEVIDFSKNDQQPDLCTTATELGKYLACQMHLRGQSRLSESDKPFTALGYDTSLLLKRQSIIDMLKLLPLKIVTTHSRKGVISGQKVKIGFIHETVKNYYLLEAIKSELKREKKSRILASKSIVHESELVKLIVLAIKDDPELTPLFLKAIEDSKQDKSTSSIIYASNSISLLVAAQHSFSECDLSNIAIKGANIVNGVFRYANLDNTDLSGVDMSNVNIIGASLNGADMRGVNLSISPDLAGHTQNVTSISFSPDGKFLASGSDDKTIKIWNPSTSECLQTLNGHTDEVNSVSFSPNGKFLASGSKDQTIKIWNSSTGNCLHTLIGDAGEVSSVCFSPDGKLLASGSLSYDGTIKIWKISTEECLQTLNGHTGWINSICFSPDGKFLASGSMDKTIKIWKINSEECLKTLNGHTQPVLSVSFSPDGKFLASGSWDQTIKIWDPTVGECLQTLNGHTDRVNNARFSPDGNFLASGSWDQTIKIWNPITGKCVQTLNGHTGGVNSVSFSADGKFLASGSQDKTIKTWKPSTSQCLQTLNGHIDFVNSVSISPDGKFLASGSDDRTIKIWNLSTSECLQTLNGHTYEVNSVNFSADGKFLASGSMDKTIKIWNLSTGACLQTLNGSSNTVRCVSLSPDGKLLASGSDNETIKIWDVNTGTCLQTLNGHSEVVTSVSFSANGKFLASGSDDKTIKIWDSSTGDCLQTLNVPSNTVRCVSLSPDGKFLATGSDNETIKIWDPSNGECLQTLTEHTGRINCVSFSHDGKFLASGSYDNTVKVFEFEAISSMWLFKSNIMATPSPLVAYGATLKGTRISLYNKGILMQKGAEPISIMIDETINQREHYRDMSLESNHMADQLSVLNIKLNTYQQTQDSRLVALSVNPPAHSESKRITSPLKSTVLENSWSDEYCRPGKDCQIFAIHKIIYDDPLLNFPTLFVQRSQILDPIEASKLSNK